MRSTVAMERKQHSSFLSCNIHRRNSHSTSPPPPPPRVVTATTLVTSATAKLRAYLCQSGGCSPTLYPTFAAKFNQSTTRTATAKLTAQRQTLKRRRSISSSSGGPVCCSQLSYYKRLYIHKLLVRVRRQRKSRSRSRRKAKSGKKSLSASASIATSTSTSTSASASTSTSVTPARGRSPTPTVTFKASNIISAMTVQERGDFITLRGANPRTGYVSPSIISLQNGRFYPCFGSNSKSNSSSRSSSHPRSDDIRADSRRKTPTSPGEALQLYPFSGNDKCRMPQQASYLPNSFAILEDGSSKMGGDARGVCSGQATKNCSPILTASTASTLEMPGKTQNINIYSADSPTYDPFVIPMPSADNPRPYNVFTAMPSAPENLSGKFCSHETSIGHVATDIQHITHSTIADKIKEQRRSLSPRKEAVELSCVLPSSSPSPLSSSKPIPTAVLPLGSVRRKPVGSPNHTHPKGTFAKPTSKEAKSVNILPNQVSTGIQGPRKFLNKVKPAIKPRIGIKVLSKRTDHNILQHHHHQTEILLLKSFDSETLYRTGWFIVKVVSAMYLLWLAVRILFALRQILDVALVPIRLVIIIVAWFFRR